MESIIDFEIRTERLGRSGAEVLAVPIYERSGERVEGEREAWVTLRRLEGVRPAHLSAEESRARNIAPGMVKEALDAQAAFLWAQRWVRDVNARVSREWGRE